MEGALRAPPSPATRRCERSFASTASARPRKATLRMFRLQIGGKAVAVQMAVELYNRLWVRKIGYAEATGHGPPGLLLTAEAIRHAIERRLDCYEFLGGVEAWEERWKPSRRDHRFVLFYPWTVAGCVGVSLDVVGAGWRRVRRTVGAS